MESQQVDSRQMEGSGQKEEASAGRPVDDRVSLGPSRSPQAEAAAVKNLPQEYHTESGDTEGTLDEGADQPPEGELHAESSQAADDKGHALPASPQVVPDLQDMWDKGSVDYCQGNSFSSAS